MVSDRPISPAAAARPHRAAWLAHGLVLAALLVPTGLARAQEVDAEPTRVNRAQPVAVPEPAKPAAAKAGGWTFGGAIRARADTLLDDADPVTGRRKTSCYLAFDTLMLKAAYDSDTLFAAAQYRFYGGDFP